MKTREKVLMIAALVLLVTGIGLAGETLHKVGDVQGRTYHADLYTDPPCVGCHNEEQPTTFPADDVCLDCHDLDDLVASTARAEEDERWQNPHDNLHYGKDVPCMECHGEHESRQPLCQGCHSFKYSNYKS